MFKTRYETMNAYFVETESYLHAEETFSKKGIVIFSGPPGCGKTMAAGHLILKLLEQDMRLTFRKISKWKQLSYIEKDEKSLVFIDNVFLSGTMDSNFKNWWYMLNKIHKEYLLRRGNEFGPNRLRIILTAGTNVIKRVCEYMRKSIPILDEKLLINLNFLTKEEKKDIFLKQVEFAKKNIKKINLHTVDDNFIEEITESKGPIGFPLCANLYACGQKYREQGSIFFSRPIEYLKMQIQKEIEGDTKNKVKTLFFVVFFYERQTKRGQNEILNMNNEIHCRQFLENIFTDPDKKFGPFAFKDMGKEAQSLKLCSFFKDIGERQYSFVHDSVYEAVGTYFCEQSIEKTANYFPLDVIQNQKYEILTDQQIIALIKRLLQETHGQRLSEVFACEIFRNCKFAVKFCSELQKKDTEAMKSFFVLENQGSAVKLPAMFWTSCYNHTFLTECFYDIITKIFSDVDNQLFVSLYGLCCAKNEDSWKIITGPFKEQFEQIKEHVLAFRDDKGNSILHLIITSHFTDKFVATAVEKVTENNESLVDCKNKKNETPIMTAVEQPIRREKVIKALIKLSAEVRYKDKNYSTVFHHCLGSCNDDETCAEYLKLLLNRKDKDTGNLLFKEDDKGNTVLNIAAKESKCSRIQSILILLESNPNIVDTLNEDGYSPLHLCVRSLSGDHDSDELECCVRVITLLLYGADPKKTSDENDEPIDQCKHGRVKNILKNYTDKKIMEDELDFLLNEMRWQEKYGEFDKECITSEKFSLGMRERIAKAVKCLSKKEKARSDKCTTDVF